VRRLTHRIKAHARRVQGLAIRKRRIDAYLRNHAVSKLQLGSGSNILEGWLNTDIHDFTGRSEVVYLDAARPFPLPDRSFDYVFSEHMIEHMRYADGLGCLAECLRVLRPGGRIRIATPSLSRIVELHRGNLTELQSRYVRWSIDNFVDGADEYFAGFVLNNFLRAWGHAFIYDEETLCHALERVGFIEIEELPVRESSDANLAGLEHHMRDQSEFIDYETMVFEARRP
jgi:predicted SAM-dependent methyltransferase